MSAAFVLLAIILEGASALIWGQWARRLSTRESLLSRNDEPRAEWKSAPELAVVYVALLWMASHLVLQFVAPSAPKPASVPDVRSLVEVTFLNFGLTLILPLAIVSSQRPWSRFGLRASNLNVQFLDGVQGYFAAVIPMTLSMFLTTYFRGPDTQNSLLKVLAGSPDLTTIVLVVVLAVVSAPLLEEMLFRVILQEWLATYIPARIAIVIVAVMFSMVHGWRDGIALLPLALILGYVFHQRHSYVAVVVIHSMFNATIVVLQLLKPETSA